MIASSTAAAKRRSCASRGSGQEFGPWKAGPDHQERVAALHKVPTRLGAEQPEGPGDERQIIRQDILAKQRLRDAGSEAGHLNLIAGLFRGRPRRSGWRP